MAGYVAAELFLALPRLDGEGRERGSLNKLPVSPASFRDIEENLREGFEVMLWRTSTCTYICGIERGIGASQS